MKDRRAEAVYSDKNGNPKIVNFIGGINEPSRDLSCDCCGVEWDRLPEFGDIDQGSNFRLLKGARRTHPDFDQIGADWQCKYCIALGEDEYFEKLYARQTVS